MLKYLVLLNFLYFSNANFIFPQQNSELYVTNSYNLSWENNYDNYHIYLLHQDSNSFISNTLSTYDNGDLVLDDMVNGTNYLWKIPRDMNYYNLNNHNFKVVITNSEGFSSSLTNNDNDYILSEYFSVYSNMNVTQPEENIIVYPTNEALLEWNGFLGYIDISLEYYDNNKWEHSMNIEKDYNSNKNYVWQIPESINDLSEYKLRIKIKELETSIIRYSYTFYTYGLHLNKPIQNQYDYLNLENNVLNISWFEDNSQGNILKLDLLDENQNFLKTLEQKNFTQNFYLWELQEEDYNNRYYINIENIDIEFSQISNLFLVNYVTTTSTETTITTTTDTTSTSTTTTDTTSTTTSLTSTTTTDTTSTTTSLTSTTKTDTTLTTTSLTSTTKTDTTLTSSTMTTTSNTATTITTTSNTATTNTNTTITETSTTNTGLTFTTTSKTYTSYTDTSYTDTSTNDTLIFDDKTITNNKSKKNKDDNHIMWILIIIACAIILIFSFVFLTKYYYDGINKVCDSGEEENNENKENSNKPNIPLPRQKNNLNRTIRHTNPMYNQEDSIYVPEYDTVPTDLPNNYYDQIPEHRIFINSNYQKFIPPRTFANAVYDKPENV